MYNADMNKFNTKNLRSLTDHERELLTRTNEDEVGVAVHSPEDIDREARRGTPNRVLTPSPKRA